MTQLRENIVNYIDTSADQTSLQSRLLSLLSARLIPSIEGWDFLSILARQTIDPLPDDHALLVEKQEFHEQTFRQEILDYNAPVEPLLKLIKHFKLTSFEINILLLALAPELDERFGDLYSHINGFPKERRLPLHKACLLLLDKHTDRNQTRSVLMKSTLWKAGLLVKQERQSLFERNLQVSEVLIGGIELDEILSSQEIELHQPSNDISKCDTAKTRPKLFQQAQELAIWSKQQQQAVIIFRSETPEMVSPYINALSNALKLPWFSFSSPSPGSMENVNLLSIMLDAIPVVYSDVDKPFTLLPIKYTSVKDTTSSHNGLIIITTTLANNQDIPIPSGVSVRQLKAYPPKPLEQANIWQFHLQDHLQNHSQEYLQGIEPDINIDLLANQNRINSEQIENTINLAQNFANQEQATHLNKDHLSRALKETINEPSSPFTTTEWAEIPWKSLVLNRQSLVQLEALVSRVHQRITVENRWDMINEKRGGATGLVALLHGESGTGKTFAAKAIASRLKLPMLRVDLSRIVSKYIGETEKNLSNVFNIAEGYRGLLFFDEADSLFGKRTGIKDAHDRHANLQVNFLLQRLEQFEGITLLASNFQQNMDAAFTRRISFSIHFPRPTPPQQLRLWKSQLPENSLAETIELQRLVDIYDLVGGEIRNCTLRAAYAAASHHTLITQEHIEDAILQEFIKMGRPQPQQRLAKRHN